MGHVQHHGKNYLIALLVGALLATGLPPWMPTARPVLGLPGFETPVEASFGRLVKRIQAVSITIANNTASNTASITSVDTTKAYVASGGSYGPSSTEGCTLDLTNATTVTATRGGAYATGSSVCKGTVVEFY